MIEVKELRIGNYVHCEWRKLMKQGDGKRTGIKKIDKVMLQHAHLYDPIPLTYDILKKCKTFRNVAESWENDVLEFWGYVGDVRFKLLLQNDRPDDGFEVYFGCAVGFACQSLDFSISYVHELQNLHFALIREELEIDLQET